MWSCGLFAQTISKNQVISKTLIQGQVRIEPAVILDSVVIPKNLSELDTAKLIRDVYGLGYFEKVSVLYDDETQTLILEVVEKKVVRKVSFEGNKKEKSEDLKELITLKAAQVFDPAKVEADIEKLKTSYDEKGFFLVEVSPKITDVSASEVEVVYVVTENKKVRVRKVNLVGNKQISDAELKAVMVTKERSFLSFLSGSGVYRDDFLAQDREMIRDAYGRKGYIDAKIKPAFVQLTPDKRSIFVTLDIEEGEQYRIGQIDVSGEILGSREDLIKKISIKTGELADSSKIQQDIFELSSIYADKGYAYANVIPQDHRDPESRVVDINYVFQPGKKVKIKKIEFRGNETTRDKVLRREMMLTEGDDFNRSKLQQSRANLQRLSIFEDVKVNTEPGETDEELTLVFDVKEQQTGTFSIGAGFNTLDSFQILARIEKRNLFGYGTDISLDARVGGRTQAFNLQYRDEYFLDTKWGMTLNAYNIERRFSNFDLTSRGGSLGMDYPLYIQGLKRLRFGLTYSLTDQILSNLRPTVSNVFQSGLTSSMTTALTWDTRNKVFEPTKGMFMRVSEEVAGGVFGGDNSFSKLEYDARWFFSWLEGTKIPIIKDSVFAFHFQLGYVTPLSSGDRVPLFERYFPGGILSLRGFPIRSLGPKIQIASSTDPTSVVTSDFVVGGNKQLIMNAEYIFPIIKPANIKGVLFFDMGNAFDNGESLLTLKGQRHSVGFGIRWFSPIGPLRFEWGYPLDRKKDESSQVFDFTIGSLF